jgi:glycosyltransferase involved in cell wall biosynthesis
LRVHDTVVDNRCTDDTRATVESLMPEFAGRLHYVYEANPGRSRALNAGIAATRGDLVGMIDDDEEIDRRWLSTIAAAFADPSTDFIGGPYLPRWGGERPKWLGKAYRAAVGWVEAGQAIQQFGPGCDAMLMGGNAVIRRALLERVGPYSADLGRTPGGRLLSCEDEDMFTRLLAEGGRGFYRPDLIIHHYIAPERLTKRYFRRWCFWRGVSRGILDRRRPAPVKYVLGVPRYLFGVAVRGTMHLLRTPFTTAREPDLALKSELAWWDLAGFVYGKHLYRGSDDSPPADSSRGADARVDAPLTPG